MIQRLSERSLYHIIERLFETTNVGNPEAKIPRKPEKEYFLSRGGDSHEEVKIFTV